MPHLLATRPDAAGTRPPAAAATLPATPLRRRALLGTGAVALLATLGGCTLGRFGGGGWSGPQDAPLSYRAAVAQTIYQRNASRIYRGRLPPLLYAVGVLEVDLDSAGRIQQMRWRRAPTQAPEAMADIERLVYAAAPFPPPPGLGTVRYTDTWLYDRSGRFQLHTLSEGQLDEGGELP